MSYEPEKGKRLDQWTTEDYKALHRIVSPRIKKGKQTGWKGVTKAAKYFGVTRPTIYEALDRQPTPPQREKRRDIKPKKVQEFEQTKGWQLVESELIRQNNEHMTSGFKNTLMQIWELFDKQDPYTLTVNQFKDLRYSPRINGAENTLMGEDDIAFNHASNIRMSVRYWLRPDAQEIFNVFYKVSKGRAGKRKEWYLDAEDITKLIPHIEELDTLIYARINLECGARPIALAGNKRSTGAEIAIERQFTPARIDRKRNIIHRFESKKKTYARAKFQDETLDLLERYIRDLGIDHQEPILPYTQQTYSARISKAAKNAGIKLANKRGFGAYVFRHTFATQALQHGVSIEAVMEQGGWTGADVITAYYAGVKEEKLDAEFLDKKIGKKQTWKEWILQFDNAWNKQYQKLLTAMLTEEESPKTKTKRKKPRAINWNAVKARANSDKVPQHLRESAKQAWAYHKQGLSDAEVAKRMGWDK